VFNQDKEASVEDEDELIDELDSVLSSKSHSPVEPSELDPDSDFDGYEDYQPNSMTTTTAQKQRDTPDNGGIVLQVAKDVAVPSHTVSTPNLVQGGSGKIRGYDIEPSEDAPPLDRLMGFPAEKFAAGTLGDLSGTLVDTCLQ